MRRMTARLDPRWRAHSGPGWSAGWTPRALSLGDGDTACVTLGAGPPCLLLPPLPGWKEAWVACAPRLAARFEVSAFDLRTRFPRGDRWARVVDDVRRVMDALGHPRVLLVGHSLGGAIAQRVALAEPARVAGLVLSSTFARVATPPGTRARRFLEQPLVLAGLRGLPEAPAAAWARRLAARGAWVFDPACDERVLAFVRFGIRHASAREVAAHLRLALAHDTRATLGTLAMPALIVRGERESAFVREACEALARALPHAARVVLPGVGHLHPLSAPDALAAAVTTWWDAAGGA
jgi:aminoacrylate hydrolase